MVEGLLTKVEKIDYLIYEFYREIDSKYLQEKPEYRFLVLNALLDDLCEFNLSNRENTQNWLKNRLRLRENTVFIKSDEIGAIIKSIVGDPTYFAASYWSPIDRKRHTISHSKPPKSKADEKLSRSAALLFYILTLKAPPLFHSAINFIAETAPRKKGIHSFYGERHPHENLSKNHQYQTWWHIPTSIHSKILEASGFRIAIDKLNEFPPKEIAESLTIIMENLDQEKVDEHIMKYESIYLAIIEKVNSFVIPSSLKKVAENFQKYLNSFFFGDSSIIKQSSRVTQYLSIKQAFFMACTHALYNIACPTKMFYTFPVRVSETCCVLTLGVQKELSIENILAMFNIIKSIYYHGLDKDYSALNGLERNRIAHGAVHKIRGPLNILKEFPYSLEEILERNLPQRTYSELFSDELGSELINLRNSIENILIGVKSLENFIDIEHPEKFDLAVPIKKAVETYVNLKVKVVKDIHFYKPDKGEKLMIFGFPSHVQFIFEELISNSIRAFKYYNKKDKRLSIDIKISEDNNTAFWIVIFTDNGPGIPPELKKSIFYSGKRGKDSGGSGKGLYLSKLFMNNIKGDIVECGDYGLGAEFHISFRKY